MEASESRSASIRFEEAIDNLRRRLIANPKEEIYNDGVSIGVQWVEESDDRRWKLAELAALLGKRYGKNVLGRLANDLKGVTKKQLSDWRQVWNYWGPDLLTDYRSHEDIFYTHFRLAMSVGKFHEDRREAINFMDDCVMNGWTVSFAEVEAAKRRGKNPGPIKIAEGLAEVIEVTQSGATFRIKDAYLLDALLERKSKGIPLTMKMYELDQEFYAEGALVHQHDIPGDLGRSDTPDDPDASNPLLN